MSVVTDYLSLPPFLLLVKFFLRFFSFSLLNFMLFLVPTFILYLVFFSCQVFLYFFQYFIFLTFFFEIKNIAVIQTAILVYYLF